MSNVHIYSPDDLKADKAKSNRMRDLKKSRSQRDPGRTETLLMPREVSSFDGVELPSVPTGDFKSFGDFLNKAFAKRRQPSKE